MTQNDLENMVSEAIKRGDIVHKIVLRKDKYDALCNSFLPRERIPTNTEPMNITKFYLRSGIVDIESDEQLIQEYAILVTPVSKD